MPSQPHLPRMPRIYLIRHGETEWSLSGQHTGKTDIPLTKNGEKVLAELGEQIVGDGKILDPSTCSQIYKSPRERAQRTFELLFQSYKGKKTISDIPSETTELVREWDYGSFEGITSHEIHQKHKKDWDIFKDGCGEQGGESIDDITKRVDEIIQKVKDVHAQYWKSVEEGKCKPGTQGGDVLIVTHGHFSKCFLARWCQLPLPTGKHFIVDAGGVSVASYDHHDLTEPALQALNLYALEH